jgi:hypothetical protein
MDCGGARLSGKGARLTSAIFPPVRQDFLGDHWIFDEGKDLRYSSADSTRLNVDIA